MNNRQRHSGIDLMRFICMLTIVLYHIQGHGELITTSRISTINHTLVIALQSVYQAAVNGYALISGYVGYKSKFRYSSFVALWLRVLFYSVGITALIWMISPSSVSRLEIRNSFFPLITGQYWYFTAYAGCFMLMPLLRPAILHLHKKESGLYLAVALFVFSILPYLLRNDPFLTSRGNHALWLMILYLVGAYIREHNPFEHVSLRKLIYLFAFASMIQMSTGFVLQQISRIIRGKETTIWYFICHDSPTVVVLSILLLAIFSKLQISIHQPAFRMLTLSSFSVYLIHDHPIVRRLVIKPLGFHLASLASLGVIPGTVAAGLLIYLICSLIDMLREVVFRALRIQMHLSDLENKIRLAMHIDTN